MQQYILEKHIKNKSSIYIYACQVNLNILHIIFLTIINSHQEITLLTNMRATVAVRPIGIPGDERRWPQGTGTVHVHASVADREVGFPGPRGDGNHVQHLSTCVLLLPIEQSAFQGPISTSRRSSSTFVFFSFFLSHVF